MTLMGLTLIGLVLLAGCGLAVVGVVSRLQLHRLDHLDRHAADFFRFAHDALDREELPERSRSMIVFYARCLKEKNSARFFWLAIRSIEGESQPRSRETESLSRDDPELYEAYMKACFSALLAISYNNWLWGTLMRAALVEFFRDEPALERAKDVVSSRLQHSFA